MIVKRLKEEAEKDSIGASDVSCADVAKTAWEEGKLVLATKMLDHEPRASKQVHLLLSMREDNLALVKAEKSGDSDLSKLIHGIWCRHGIILIESCLWYVQSSRFC